MLLILRGSDGGLSWAMLVEGLEVPSARMKNGWERGGGCIKARETEAPVNSPSARSTLLYEGQLTNELSSRGSERFHTFLIGQMRGSFRGSRYVALVLVLFSHELKCNAMARIE